MLSIQSVLDLLNHLEQLLILNHFYQYLQYLIFYPYNIYHKNLVQTNLIDYFHIVNLYNHKHLHSLHLLSNDDIIIIAPFLDPTTTYVFLGSVNSKKWLVNKINVPIGNLDSKFSP